MIFRVAFVFRQWQKKCMTELLLASHPCSECLTSKNRIVPDKRADELIRKCRTGGVHFVCHKGSLAGLNLHCRGVHATAPAASYQLAERWGIPIREIDPDTLS